MQSNNSNLRENQEEISLSVLEAQFLKQANDPVSRLNLLARLQELGLLSEFLAAENGTNE